MKGIYGIEFISPLQGSWRKVWASYDGLCPSVGYYALSARGMIGRHGRPERARYHRGGQRPPVNDGHQLKNISPVRAK